MVLGLVSDLRFVGLPCWLFWVVVDVALGVCLWLFWISGFAFVILVLELCGIGDSAWVWVCCDWCGIVLVLGVVLGSVVGRLWLDVTLNMVELCCFVWLRLFAGLACCVIVAGLAWVWLLYDMAEFAFYDVFVCG